MIRSNVALDIFKLLSKRVFISDQHAVNRSVRFAFSHQFNTGIINRDLHVLATLRDLICRQGDADVVHVDVGMYLRQLQFGIFSSQEQNLGQICCFQRIHTDKHIHSHCLIGVCIVVVNCHLQHAGLERCRYNLSYCQIGRGRLRKIKRSPNLLCGNDFITNSPAGSNQFKHGRRGMRQCKSRIVFHIQILSLSSQVIKNLYVEESLGASSILFCIAATACCPHFSFGASGLCEIMVIGISRSGNKLVIRIGCSIELYRCFIGLASRLGAVPLNLTAQLRYNGIKHISMSFCTIFAHGARQGYSHSNGNRICCPMVIRITVSMRCFGNYKINVVYSVSMRFIQELQSALVANPVHLNTCFRTGSRLAFIFDKCIVRTHQDIARRIVAMTVAIDILVMNDPGILLDLIFPVFIAEILVTTRTSVIFGIAKLGLIVLLGSNLGYNVTLLFAFSCTTLTASLRIGAGCVAIGVRCYVSLAANVALVVAVSGLVGAIFQNRTASVITYVIFIGSGISVRVVARAVNVTIAVGVANVILLAVAAGGRVCRTTFITFVIAIVVYVMTAIVRLLSAAVITKVVVIVSVSMRVGTRAVNGTSAVGVAYVILLAVAAGGRVCRTTFITFVIAIVVYVMTAIVRLLSAAVITKVVVIVSVNMRVGTRAVNGTSAVSITGMILAAVATSGHNVIAALAVTDVIAIVISIGVTKGSNKNTLGLILCPL